MVPRGGHYQSRRINVLAESATRDLRVVSLLIPAARVSLFLDRTAPAQPYRSEE